MPFKPADGEAARWRRVDAYIDKEKGAGDLVTFQELQQLLDIKDKTVIHGVIQQVRRHREEEGKPTLVSVHRAGWTVARPEDELAEDARRHQRVVAGVEGRARILDSLQARRAELTGEEQRTLDFRTSQVAAQAAVVGSRRMSGAEILGRGSTAQPVPIMAENEEESWFPSPIIQLKNPEAG